MKTDLCGCRRCGSGRHRPRSDSSAGRHAQRGSSRIRRRRLHCSNRSLYSSRHSPSHVRRPPTCNTAKFIGLNAKFLVFDTQFLVFNTKFLIFSVSSIISRQNPSFSAADPSKMMDFSIVFSVKLTSGCQLHPSVLSQAFCCLKLVQDCNHKPSIKESLENKCCSGGNKCCSGIACVLTRPGTDP